MLKPTVSFSNQRRNVSFNESEDVYTSARESRVSIRRSSTNETLDPYLEPQLTRPEAYDLAVVFEDLADKLNVVGRSMNAKEIDIKTKASLRSDLSLAQSTTLKIGCATEEKQCSKILTEHYNTLNTRKHKTALRSYRFGDGSRRKTLEERMSSVILEEFYTKKLTKEGKIQSDRGYLEKAVHDVMESLVKNSSFDALEDLVYEQHEMKEEMIESIQRCLDMDEKRRYLKAQIASERKIRTHQLSAMDHEIWALEDQSQELRIRTDAQNNYVQRQSNMMKLRSKKMCQVKDDAITETKNNAKTSIILEERAHSSMMRILKKKLRQLTEQLEFWQDKHNADIINLRGEIELMIANREITRMRQIELKKQVAYMERYVHDDHRVKRKLIMEGEKAAKAERAALKIQALWRGYFVRSGLV